ncbi:acid phosphatase [Penicillium taxi]|uniref:acid phosphatase n=1 Tax=Penicillium taxi TaxID=168475 RepID=UPI002545486E|nr:acid phosphatase [Penicillium taxi]KAJ5899018.1 acid phosphatase [Penicillium taxi]
MASLLLLTVIGSAAATAITTTEPAKTAIQAAEATTVPETWTSDIKGTAFNRFYQIWLENDYSSAAENSDQQWLAKQGITLTNYYAVGHSSQPNYCAAVGGDNYGADNVATEHSLDEFWRVPSNISTIVDLLDTKGISWSEYMQDIPYAGFQGFNYSNQDTWANDYVRKHNPLVSYDKIANNDTALRLIKGFDQFEEELKKKELPQWAFITPNMTNDGHDTNITYASTWLRGFVSNLMNNTYVWDNTLLLLTFDETETYTERNRVFSILLGGAIPKDLVGTKDDTVYTHYSSIATVSANWDLPSLGRWDCGANLFQFVADKVNYTNWDIDATNLYMNSSMPGPLEQWGYSIKRNTWPVPVTSGSCSGGSSILQAVVDTYKGQTPTYNYSTPFSYDATFDVGLGISYSRNGETYVSGVNATGVHGFDKGNSTSITSSSATASTSNGAAAQMATPVFTGFLAVVLGLLSFL